jgi:hypothetical protein
MFSMFDEVSMGKLQATTVHDIGWRKAAVTQGPASISSIPATLTTIGDVHS